MLMLLAAGNAEAKWPKDCGNEGQKTCTGPAHYGCKDDLEKCDMPGARDVCRKKGECPSESRNKHDCPDCGHDGQEPCLFKKYCHMCVDGHHVSPQTGKCTKTEGPVDTIESMLRKVDGDLTKAEKDCRKFGEKIENGLNDKGKEKLRDLLDAASVSKKLVDDSLYYGELAATCYEEQFNGIVCGAIPWVKGYNKLAIRLLNTDHDDDFRDVTKEVGKDAVEMGKKYVQYFIHGDACKYMVDPVARAMCASVYTMVDVARDPVNCAVNTVKDLAEKNKQGSGQKKKPEKADVKDFVASNCYTVGVISFTLAADQALAALTAETGEAVELPKDAKAVLKAVKTIAKAKIKLEQGAEAADKFDDSKAKQVMEQHKSCDGVLKYLD
ncbi:MAG: hypothetical protein AB1413_10795 [Thermodesulfobacteriota bacterium]